MEIKFVFPRVDSGSRMGEKQRSTLEKENKRENAQFIALGTLQIPLLNDFYAEAASPIHTFNLAI